MPRARRNEFPDMRGKDVQQAFRAMPRIIGRVAVNFYKDSFRRSGFIDRRMEKWPARKRADRNERERGPRALLVKSGRLRRSIRIIRTLPSSVTVGSDVPYAEIHNNGGTIRHPGGTAYLVIGGRAVFITNKKAATMKGAKRTKAHEIPIPRRRFIGKSELLDKRIVKVVTQAVEKLLV